MRHRMRHQSALPCQTPVLLKKSLVCPCTCHADKSNMKQVIIIHVHEPIIHSADTSQPLVVNTAATALVPPDPVCLEIEENQCVQSFVLCGCGCQLWGGKSCTGQFSFDHFFEFRGQCKELTRAELDMALIGQLNAFTFSSEQTARATTHRHPSDGRQRAYTVFWHCGLKVCRKTFLFVHMISENKSSLVVHGLSPLMHGNTRRVPANTISFADTQQVVHYISTYAEAHAILLPGRIPGYKRSDLQLLPSDTTKRNVWLLYSHSLQSLPTSHHRVKILPHIIITKPMSDVCWICQKNSIAIMRSANQPEEQKSQVINTYTYKQQNTATHTQTEHNTSTPDCTNHRIIYLCRLYTTQLVCYHAHAMSLTPYFSPLGPQKCRKTPHINN